MLEFILGYDNDAINILIEDHEKVKDLFEQYEKAETRREKLRIAAQTIEELSIHAVIEEEIFYPAIRKQLKKDLMNEADEEHHVARILVAELSQMDGSEDHYDAKYKVLSENIKHHIKEEEGEMMPMANDLDLDFDRLAQQMLARKQQLKKTGLPFSLEDKMVQATRNNDTPARNARKETKKPASGAMMKAKGKPAKSKTPARATASKVKPGTRKSAKPAAKKSSKPKLKIVSHRAASAAKSVRKPASKTRK